MGRLSTGDPARRHRLSWIRALIPASVLIAAALVTTGAVAIATRHVQIDAHISSGSSSSPYGRFGKPLSHNPYNHAAEQIRRQISTTSAQDINLLRRISGQPQADWFVGAPSETAAVRSRVELAAKQGAIAQLVVYNLPHRDCGLYSANDLTSAADYRSWFRTFITGLGNLRAIVIIEPDGLAQADCLTPAQRSERFDLIAWVVREVHAQGSWAYIDAGNARWLSAQEAARRLALAGVRDADGFTLNVANYQSTPDSIRYGSTISRLTGGKHFIIDTGRNGLDSGVTETCNPPAAGLGRAPTENTGYRLVDAFLWIKTPGDSDGSCNGGPPAGAWFQRYALMLARNANLGTAG